MSFPQYGRDMDRPSAAGGSVRRAREMAEAGMRRPPPPPPLLQQSSMTDASSRPIGVSTAGQSRLPRPQAPAGLQKKDGQIGVAISRPTQVPQWPLPAPIPQPVASSDAEPYRPPPGRSQPPQRPPRPSRVPSILDASRVQDPTPVFQYAPQNGRDSSQDLVPSIPPTPSSRMTNSSVGSIPDFPVPVNLPPAGPPRRSVNLGPPPSARRGASSFYSNASFVSPIPEESPRSGRTRSHASFASSAAMPESWGTPSPGPSPNYAQAYFDEVRESIYDDDSTDESRLVRSASIGKRGRPALVMNRGTPANAGATADAATAVPGPSNSIPNAAVIPIGITNGDAIASSSRPVQLPATADSGAFKDDSTNQPPRPGPIPLQKQDPFASGTGYREGSSSSGTLPTSKAAPTPALTPDAMLGAYAAASSLDPTDPSNRTSPSPRPYSRLSAIRRPPRLDMEAVNNPPPSRASMTSLPDLIRRATRLAAMIDRGKRPASRFESFDDYPDEKASGRDGERELSMDDRHQSGLSDMLAAFPPPVQTRRQSTRGSWVGSWPLGQNRSSRSPPQATAGRSPGSPETDASSVKRGRRCCGLPLWGFITIVVIVLGIVAAAILVPLEFFVFRRLNNGGFGAEPALAQCQAQLSCSNGGTNVISQGICSCICTNGFTGSSCQVPGGAGCTTTNLVSMGEDSANISNVTLGQAIPRLIAQSQGNFSIPLSGTTVLAKFNSASLSCIAQNSLVTFDGRSMRMGSATTEVTEGEIDDAAVRQAAFVSVSVITILPGQQTTVTLNALETGVATVASEPGVGAFSTLVPPFTVSTIFATTTTFRIPNPTPGTTTTTVTVPPPTATFTVTEEVLDFARVAVLFILQEASVQEATTAQSTLQRFFTTASQGSRRLGTGVAVQQALNVTLGGGNTVDLVRFRVDIGSGQVGAQRQRRDIEDVLGGHHHPHFHRHRSPILPQG